MISFVREKTEPLYFEGFKQLIENNPIYKGTVLIEIEPCAAETMRVIGMTERYVCENGIERGQIRCEYDSVPFDTHRGHHHPLGSRSP
ncbi:MAG: RloB family protein [Blautia sp.]|nr:RloB family protein [Blautia sp.]